MAETTTIPADTIAFMLLSSTANTLIACAASDRTHDDFSSATRGGNTPETQHNCWWVQQARAHHQALSAAHRSLHSQGIRDCCIIKHVRKQAQVLLHSGQSRTPRKIGSSLTKLGRSMCLPACKLLGTTGDSRGRRHLFIQHPQTSQLCACSKPCRHPCARSKATC